VQNLARAVAERFGLVPFWDHVLERRVAKTSWHQGDGAALAALFIIQVGTGVVLTLTYTNSIDHAYDSVRYITFEQPLGWLLRAIHYWTAGAMVVMVVFHFFRHLLLGGYKPPREGTWTTGVFQYWLVLTMSFTGYVLRWDERSVYAARVVLNMFGKVPWIGEGLVVLVQGGPQLGSQTLSRFYSVHTIVVPFLLAGLIAYHLYLVILHGVTSIAERRKQPLTAADQKKVYHEAAHSEENGEWFYPDTVLQTGLMAFAVFSVVFVSAVVLGPQELYPEANLVERTIPVEEWWFWWYSSAIALVPRALVTVFLVGYPIALFAGMLLLPLLDRGSNRGIRNRPVWTAFVILAAVGLLALSALRVRSPWTGWPDPGPPPVPHGATLTAEAEQGRQLFARYGCNSCHAVASQGREVGPDLAKLKHRLSPSELRNFILSPPAGVPMPSYRGRVSEEELARLVDFVLVAQTFPRK
jgi:ubiquinol-cytochrome c reductase cytochrome b subunit